MKIGILGSRGIPNHYGGFEQFAQFLAEGLVGLGHEVFVYNSHNHPYQDKNWQGVQIIHCYDPEHKIGGFGQLVYDFNCMLDSVKRDFDIILQLGYSNSFLWNWLGKIKPVIITNMDGLEWTRAKYSYWAKRFLKYTEKQAVMNSDFLIADSIGVQKYLYNSYGQASFYVPYGATVFEEPQISAIETWGVKPYQYFLTVARLEPENNLEMILEGYSQSKSQLPMLVVGNHQQPYGKFLKNKFPHPNIHFLGGIYDLEKLNNLRFYAKMYFHGHSVGGTNPSLLEAMACQSLICAHDNIFNRGVSEQNAYYFQKATDIKHLIINHLSEEPKQKWTKANLDKLQQVYSWPKIVSEYENIFQYCLDAKQSLAFSLAKA